MSLFAFSIEAFSPSRSRHTSAQYEYFTPLPAWKDATSSAVGLRIYKSLSSVKTESKTHLANFNHLYNGVDVGPKVITKSSNVWGFCTIPHQNQTKTSYCIQLSWPTPQTTQQVYFFLPNYHRVLIDCVAMPLVPKFIQ